MLIFDRQKIQGPVDRATSRFLGQGNWTCQTKAFSKPNAKRTSGFENAFFCAHKRKRMRIEQRVWTDARGWSAGTDPSVWRSAQMGLVFGATDLLRKPEVLDVLRSTYPMAHLMGCSTCGDVHGMQVRDDSLVLTAVRFDHTQLRAIQTSLRPRENGFQAGQRIAEMLPPAVNGPASEGPLPLAHVVVLCDGLKVNGSTLVAGINSQLPPNVGLTGGLAGDGMRLKETLVFSTEGPRSESIAILGFYSQRLKIGYGSQSGWDPFGPDRLITRSEGNVLFEVDGRPALELYKLYLGKHAKELPATAFYFPLSVRARAEDSPVIRACLAINEENQSMTFAGDMPGGGYARLMRTNINRVLDGAADAAQRSCQGMESPPPELALLISCVARRMVLKQRTDEELEAVRDTLGSRPVMTGFYSYGEIAPFGLGSRSELHNQTMTITTFSES
jgi:hypothetical protein